MRRYLGITLATGLAAIGLWRGLAVQAGTHPAAKKQSRAGMTQNEWRYFNSQESHWRQCMLNRQNKN